MSEFITLHTPNGYEWFVKTNNVIAAYNSGTGYTNVLIKAGDHILLSASESPSVIRALIEKTSDKDS